MVATSRIKWFGSIVLTSFLLIQAVIGGNWGTDYSASAGVYAAPFIESIIPTAVLAGSPDTVVVIYGSDFGTLYDTRVRLTGTGVDVLLVPLEIYPEGLSIIITEPLLTEPQQYILTVAVSSRHRIPTIPFPPDVEVSNPVPFTVLYSMSEYLPIINKITTYQAP